MIFLELSVVGGDLRIVKLIEMLAKEKFLIYTYAIENADVLKEYEEVVELSSLNELQNSTNIIISGVPFSNNMQEVNDPFSDKKILVQDLFKNIQGKTLIAGSISPNVESLAKQYNIKVIDLLKREELAVLNTISTAEGTIQIAMEETAKTIHGSNVLVMGFGRIGKILCKMLSGIGAKVYAEARKNEDIAWIKAYGYNAIYLNELKETLGQYDIIINTIPSLILNREYLSNVRQDALIIDIASTPGGVDRQAAKELGIRSILALSLPGKVAPITSAEFIKETLNHILKEL